MASHEYPVYHQPIEFPRVPIIYRFRPFAEAFDAWLQGRVLSECRVPQGEEFGRTVMELVRGREALSQLEGR